MSDDDLLALARKLETAPTPRARLAYSHALTRAGRLDDALAALLPGSDDPTIRALIGHAPTWGRAEVSTTRWTGARPVTRAPRIRFRAHVPGASLGSVNARVLASPLAYVLPLYRGSGASYSEVNAVLDPATGELRHQWPRTTGAAEADIVRHYLVEPRSDGVFTRDLVTGEERCLLRAEGTLATLDALVTPHGLVLRDERGLLVFTLEAEVTTASFAWRFELGPAPPSPGVVASVSRDLVLVQRWDRRDYGTEVIALDRASGRELWRADWVHAADGQGALTRPIRSRGVAPDALVAIEPGGERRTIALHGSPYLVAPEHLLGTGHPINPGRLEVRDRRTGARGALLGAAPPHTSLAGARDVIYAFNRRVPTRAPFTVEDALAAWSTDGRELWRVPVPRDPGSPVEPGFGFPRAFAAGEGVLLVLGEDGSLLCIEDGEGEGGRGSPSPPAGLPASL